MPDQYKIPYTIIDFSTGSYPMTFDFGDMSNSSELSLNIYWESLNALDASVVMAMRQNQMASWSQIPYLCYDLNTYTGSCVLINKAFVCAFGGLYVNRGSCSTGRLHVWTIPHK